MGLQEHRKAQRALGTVEIGATFTGGGIALAVHTFVPLLF